MTSPRDPRSLLWGLLGLWVGIELLHSSRWWPPTARPLVPVAPGTALPADRLQAVLSSLPRALGQPTRVWFAPYTTFPETGFVESVARRGVYDTLLAIPPTGLAANYGASKLTPADTLFSLASIHGLAAELRLARHLGFGWFALDLGAVTDPAAAMQLCRTSPGCRLTGDAYALFPIQDGATDLERRLALLRRRQPLLPHQSAGPSWGPLVFAPLQWGPTFLEGVAAPGHDPRLLLQAPARISLELYRHPLQSYPQAVQPWLRLRGQDVQLVLAPDVQAAVFCIGPPSRPCRQVMLGPGARRLAIGDLLPAGQVSRIDILDIRRSQPGQSPFTLELRAPVASQALLAGFSSN